MPKTAGEVIVSRLATAAFLKPWVFPNLFYAPGKEAADLIVRFGDTLLIASEKTKRFPANMPTDVAWARWYSHTIEASARQIRGAERRLMTESAQLFLDARCKKPAPAHLFQEPPKEVFRMIFAHGSGLHTQRYFQSDTASLCISSDRSGTPPTRPFSVNPFLSNEEIFHVLDDYTSIELFRFIDTAPDLFNYLRKKEALLRSFEFFDCHGEEELVQHHLRTMDSDGEHGFEKLIEKGRAQNVNGVYWSEDTYSEFQALPVIEQRLADDAPSYFVDRFINYLASLADKRVSPAAEYEERALRALATFNRTARRMLGGNMFEFAKMEHEQTYQSRLSLGTKGEPLGEFCIVYLSVRADLMTENPDDIDLVQDMVAMLAEAYAHYAHELRPHATDVICFSFVKDKSKKPQRYSEALALFKPQEFSAEKIAEFQEIRANLGVGANASEERRLHMREYRHELPRDE